MPEILLEIAGKKEDDASLVMIITIAENTVPQEEDDRDEKRTHRHWSVSWSFQIICLFLSNLQAVGRQI